MFNRSAKRLLIPKLSSNASHFSRRSFFRDAHSELVHRPATATMRVRPTILSLTTNSLSPTQTRAASFTQRVKRTYRAAARDIWRNNPVFLPFAIVSIIAAGAISTYILGRFYARAVDVDDQVQRFPAPVAKELRKALYSTEISPDPKKAMKHFREALRITHELGMHPWSDEVVGIRLRMVDTLIQAGYHEQAARKLEVLIFEGSSWVVATRERYSLALSREKPISDPNLQEILLPDEETKRYEMMQTDKTVKKIIGMYLLLADLYEDEYLKTPVKGFGARRRALKLLQEEIKSRQSRGLPALATPEEGLGWMNAEEVSNVMTDLGETWLRGGRPDKALELLMPSIAILRDVEGKQISCRQVVLLANIAAAMFDHQPQSLADQEQQDTSLDRSKKPVVTVEQQMNSSRAWALKSIEVSKMVSEDLRDEDCDLGCAAAADVLSAIAEWQGATEEERKWLREKKRYSESAKFVEGVEQASKLLASLDRRAKKRARDQQRPI